MHKFKIPFPHLQEINEKILPQLNQNFEYLNQYFSESPFTKLGQGDNYTEVEDDGTLEFKGNATVWDDIRVPAQTTRVGGSAPGFETFSGNLKTFLFDKNTDEEIHFNVQIPHNYKLGTDLHAHVHWSPMDTDTGSVTWKLEYIIANINATFSSAATLNVTDAADGTALKHQYADLGDIDGSGIDDVSTMLVCRLYRDVSDNDDYDNDAALLEVDFHYEIDTVGSRTETTK